MAPKFRQSNESEDKKNWQGRNTGMDHVKSTWYQSPRFNHGGLGLSLKDTHKPMKTHMSDPKKKKQEEIDVEEQLGTESKVDTFVKFIDFMKELFCDKTAYKQKKKFKDEINEVLIWFHKTCIGKGIEDRMPPKLDGLDVCMFELLMLVKGMGGYYQVTLQQGWDEVAMGFGYTENHDMDFKTMYEDYLLQAVLFYHLAKNNTVGTVGTPEGHGEEVGDSTNSFDDHPDWYVDHIKAIGEEENAALNEDHTDQRNKTSIDHINLEETKSASTHEDSDGFIIIT